MGLVNIEGKEISLDDSIINAGIPAIKAALSVDFPDVENADITIVTPTRAGAPRTASVVKRGTGKGETGAVRTASGTHMKNRSDESRIRLKQIDCRHDEVCELRLVDGVHSAPYIWIGSEDRGMYGLVPGEELEKLRRMVDRAIEARRK